MGSCVKCGKKTETQYECYSASYKDLEKDNASSSDYTRHKDFFCNKCVVGSEGVVSFLLCLLMAGIIAAGIYLIADDYISADFIFYFFIILLLVLAVLVCNVLWFVNVLKALATGGQRETKWYYGMLFLSSTVHYLSTNSGVEAYIKYIYMSNGDKKYITAEAYNTMKRGETNTLLNTPAYLTIDCPQSIDNTGFVLDVYLNGEQMESIKKGQTTIIIPVTMKFNHLTVGSSSFEFDAYDGGSGEVRLKADASLGITHPKYIPDFTDGLR